MDRKKNYICEMLVFVGMGVFFGKLYNKCCKKVKVEKSIISPNRFEVGFHILSNWLKIKNEAKKLETYFLENEISTIAIYGMGALGERLFEELKNSDIKVLYAIDRIANSKKIDGLKIVSVEEELSIVDAIVITPVQDYYTIEEQLEKKTDADIISLEDIIDFCR